MKRKRRSFDSAEVRFAQDDSSFHIRKTKDDSSFHIRKTEDESSFHIRRTRDDSSFLVRGSSCEHCSIFDLSRGGVGVLSLTGAAVGILFVNVD
jgi:hypothetical protein